MQDSILSNNPKALSHGNSDNEYDGLRTRLACITILRPMVGSHEDLLAYAAIGQLLFISKGFGLGRKTTNFFLGQREFFFSCESEKFSKPPINYEFYSFSNNKRFSRNMADFDPQKQSSSNPKLGVELNINLAQEKQHDLAELEKLFPNNEASFEAISNFYDKLAEKWSKRVFECTKVIQENQNFYQEGRKLWLKDLATLSKALGNMKSSFEATMQDVLGHTTALERKLCEILNEISPFAKAQDLHSELEETSSGFVMTKISAEIREKVREMAKFHAKIDSLLEGGDWIKGVEIETSKTIEKVSKYLAIWNSTTDATRPNELSEEGKSEAHQHASKQPSVHSKQPSALSNQLGASVSLHPMRLSRQELKLSKFIGEQGKQSQIQNIINANQSSGIVALSSTRHANFEKKALKKLKIESNIDPEQKEVIKQLPEGLSSPVMGNEPKINRPAVFVASNNCKTLPTDVSKQERSVDNSRKIGREAHNVSYQSLALVEKDVTHHEINLETESHMHSFKQRVEGERLSPIAHFTCGLDNNASRRKDSPSSCNPFSTTNDNKENANPNEIQKRPKQKFSKFKYLICGCK